LPVADVDPDVAGQSVLRVGALEENEVARLQLIRRDRRTRLELLVGRARDADARLRVEVLREPGAIEAARRLASPGVRRAEILDRATDDCANLGRHVRGELEPDLLTLRPRRDGDVAARLVR